MEERYLATMHQRLTIEDWEDIIERAIIDAKNGEWRARDWLSSHVTRKAPQVLAIEREDNTIALQIRDALLAGPPKEDELDELPTPAEPAWLPAGGG